MKIDTTWGKFKDDPLGTYRRLKKKYIYLSLKKQFIIKVQILTESEQGLRCDFCSKIKELKYIVSKEIGPVHACRGCIKKYGLIDIKDEYRKILNAKN